MRSVIWKIFTKSKYGPFARCNICKNDYKTSGNTSNLLDHCKRKHKLEFDRLLKQNDAEINNEANEEDCDDPVAGPTVVKQRKVTVKDYMTKECIPYDKNSDRKITLDQLLVEYIAHDLEPFRIVERDSFKQFVHELDKKYELPSRTHLKKVLLPQLYNKRKVVLAKILSTVNHISITTNLWTSTANDGIITITAHFIYDDDIKSAVLETRKVVGHHTAEHIAEELDEMLQKWNIREKIVTMVSDNASNMIKTATVLKVRHSPCFAHTINLVALDVLETESVKPILKHVKEIVTYFRNSTLAMDKLRDMQKQFHKEELKLIQDTPTRWNSSFYMIQRILKLRDPLLLAMSELRKSPRLLTAEDVLILEDLIIILSLLELATKDISGSLYVTMSLIIPLIHGILSKLNSIGSSIKTDIGKEVFEKLKSSVITRLYPYESRTANIMATVLDPRLRAANQIAKENAQQVKQQAKKQYDKSVKREIFEIGDKVLLYNEALRRGRSKKLESQWAGPYTIVEKHNEASKLFSSPAESDPVVLAAQHYWWQRWDPHPGGTGSSSQPLVACNKQVQLKYGKDRASEKQPRLSRAQQARVNR
ncbi:PREDICTED: zinc finger BED domain-containing protein 1-like [Wasmannia auropunctata]|uniref:zinc finger BED domain-containing protein 1-like n=1 Tax=Wasmannia auropunctata TaxID=64793 RepID=UPI0005EE8021|nr:PREDICTED: zinc finger BED domain-containing protein 1-like [Wasmannia auropunctata]